MASSGSTRPWIWVIEALANFKQVDSSILIDLVKKTPEISADLGTNAREMVSLRILESFSARQSGNKKVGSAPDSKIDLDPSKQCEDVVRHILHEMSSSNLKVVDPEMLKWDVQTFITRKRACLPKCTLPQLKEAILGGNHPILAPLKERSGVSISNQLATIPLGDSDLNAIAGRLEGSCGDAQAMSAGGNLTSPTLENLEGFVQEDAPNGALLPSKRDRNDLDTEDRISMDDEGDTHLTNAKKLKLDATFTSQAIGQKAVHVNENGPSEDLVRCKGEHTVRDGSDLAKLSQVGGFGQSTFAEDGHDPHISSTMPGNDPEYAELQHNNPINSCDNNSVPQDASGDGSERNLPVNEAKDDGEHCAEMGTSSAPSPVGTHRICGDEVRDKCEKSQLNTSCGDAKDDRDHNRGQELSSDSDGYQDEKVDVALKKRTFLSSQCTFSPDSLATADCTELNLCMKCNKGGGKLLVCSGSACPLVFHQKCLGSAPSFDDRGKFYCPFCAYSHAISEYLEVKKKASLARKDLAVFAGLDNGHRANKRPKRCLKPKQNQSIQEENVNGNTRANYEENYVNEVNSPQFSGNIEDKQQVVVSVSHVNDNLPAHQEGATLNGGELRASVEGDKEGGELGPQCQSASALKGQQIEAEAGGNHRDDNSTCRDKEIVHATKRRAKDVSQKEVLRQRPVTDSTQQAARPPNIVEDEISEEENDKATSKFSIDPRRREKQDKKYTYPAIPQLRRKKLSWTCAEEDILEEGVRRFSSNNEGNIPWKSILEFGSDVFQKGRTAIDIKDKWRNICKQRLKPK